MLGGILEAISLLIAKHCEGFSGSCGPIGEDCCIFAGEDGFDEWLYSLRVDLFRGLVGIDTIEGVTLFFRPVVYF